MDLEAVVHVIAQCGGAASTAELVSRVGISAVRTAHAQGLIERARRGHYVLPGLEGSVRSALRLNATVSHRSAAMLKGWSVTTAPRRPELVVPRNRELPAPARRGVDLRWRDVPPDDVVDRMTSDLRTVVDCARDLPMTESLAVADSALRSGAVTPDELRDAVCALPRPGRSRARTVLLQATELAANPFESAARALVLEAVGPLFVPQVPLSVAGETVHPDLVCESLRIVIEMDSHEFHTQKHQIVRDCWRYTELQLAGWLVIRLSWEHVMRHHDWVRESVESAVLLRSAA